MPIISFLLIFVWGGFWGKRWCLPDCLPVLKTVCCHPTLQHCTNITRLLLLSTSITTPPFTALHLCRWHQGGSNTHNGRLLTKSAHFSNNVCYKVSSCKYCQWQSCKAFTGSSNRAKNGRLWNSRSSSKFLPKLTYSFKNAEFQPIFTALHGMQSRYSDGNSVCLSVCPSVCQTRALWQNGRKLSPYFYTTR